MRQRFLLVVTAGLSLFAVAASAHLAPPAAVPAPVVPAPAPAPSPAAGPPIFVVFFPPWSGDVDDAAQSVIKQAADAAKQKPGIAISVTGFADKNGSVAANHDLEMLRAQRVVDFLVTAGVPRKSLKMAAKSAHVVNGEIGRRVEISLAAAH